MKLFFDKKRWILIALIILFAITSILFYSEKRHNDRAYEQFLNRLYYQVDSAMKFPLTEKSDISPERLYNFHSSLVEIDTTLTIGELLLDKELKYNEQIRLETAPRIFEIASKEEITTSDQEFLEEVFNRLEKVREGMYSEKTGQEDPELSIKELNNFLDILEQIHH
ncbi:hypothetical protein [Alkalibacillus aidingensis]|uniref:hypothetical protein n=1 Tax=Alkalibacillus aidingensis TaxID=2747607 RepID=UPI0016602835|nr:hypothetical protein [Alkalibacillus aidingensis]